MKDLSILPSKESTSLQNGPGLMRTEAVIQRVFQNEVPEMSILF